MLRASESGRNFFRLCSLTEKGKKQQESFQLLRFFPHPLCMQEERLLQACLRVLSPRLQRFGEDKKQPEKTSCCSFPASICKCNERLLGVVLDRGDLSLVSTALFGVLIHPPDSGEKAIWNATRFAWQWQSSDQLWFDPLFWREGRTTACVAGFRWREHSSKACSATKLAACSWGTKDKSLWLWPFELCLPVQSQAQSA